MPRFRVTALFSVLFMSALPSAYAAECEPGNAAKKYPTYAGKVVKVAVSPTSPPFSYSDPQNFEKLAGLEVELIEKALTCAGIKYEFIRGAWSALLPALYSGASDVMIGAVNYRPERAEKADFIAYMRAGQGVVVAQGNPKSIKTLDDLCGTIGSSNAIGSAVSTIAEQSSKCTAAGKSAVDFRPAVDVDAAYRQLLNGRVDFVMDDAPAAANRVKKVQGMEFALPVTTDMVSGMVVQKGNREMLQIVADGLKVQQRDGTLNEVAAKYGLPTEMLIPIETRQ